MSNILVTGGTGYIGGKLAEYYNQKGVQVRLLVQDETRLSNGLKEKCEIIRGDLTRPGTLIDAVGGIETIVSAAGLLGYWGVPYKRLYEVNVQGVENLIRAAFDGGVRRMVHLSAGGVTGPAGLDPVDENYPPAPRTEYERTKWEGEKRALDMALKDNLNLLIVRPTFTYGPGDPHKLSLFLSVKKGRFAYIGNPLSTFHPVYIDDLVSGIDLAVKSDLSKTTVIIGGPRPVTKRELITGIANALGVRKPELRIPTLLADFIAQGFEFSARIFNFKPPLTRSRVLALSGNWGYSIQRAREKLGYEPAIDLQEGLQRTVSWYREHGWL